MLPCWWATQHHQGKPPSSLREGPALTQDSPVSLGQRACQHQRRLSKGDQAQALPWGGIGLGDVSVEGEAVPAHLQGSPCLACGVVGWGNACAEGAALSAHLQGYPGFAAGVSGIEYGCVEGEAVPAYPLGFSGLAHGVTRLGGVSREGGAVSAHPLGFPGPAAGVIGLGDVSMEDGPGSAHLQGFPGLGAGLTEAKHVCVEGEDVSAHPQGVSGMACGAAGLYSKCAKGGAVAARLQGSPSAAAGVVGYGPMCGEGEAVAAHPPGFLGIPTMQPIRDAATIVVGPVPTEAYHLPASPMLTQAQPSARRPVSSHQATSPAAGDLVGGLRDTGTSTSVKQAVAVRVTEPGDGLALTQPWWTKYSAAPLATKYGWPVMSTKTSEAAKDCGQDQMKLWSSCPSEAGAVRSAPAVRNKAAAAQKLEAATGQHDGQQIWRSARGKREGKPGVDGSLGFWTEEYGNISLGIQAELFIHQPAAAYQPADVRGCGCTLSAAVDLLEWTLDPWPVNSQALKVTLPEERLGLAPMQGTPAVALHHAAYEAVRFSGKPQVAGFSPSACVVDPVLFLFFCFLFMLRLCAPTMVTGWVPHTYLYPLPN